MSSRSKSIFAIVISLFAIVAYKLWKYFLREEWLLDPKLDYVEYEAWSTMFRGINTVVGVAGAWWVLYGPRVQFRLTWGRASWVVLGYTISYVAIKAISSVGSFHLQGFLYEVPVNLLTGLSEEFLFRGLLLVGVARVAGVRVGFIVSAIVFTLFHFDSHATVVGFTHVALAGILYALAFWRGASLLMLSLLHFLWDQIHFGLRWESTHPAVNDLLVLAVTTAAIILVLKSKGAQEVEEFALRE